MLHVFVGAPSQWSAPYNLHTSLRNSNNRSHGPLNRHEILPVAHAPGLPGTFSPPPTSRKPLVSDPGMHHGTCVTHVSWFVSGSLTRGDGENVPDIPGACRTQTFAYLVRGPCSVARTMTIYWMGWYKYINSAWQWALLIFCRYECVAIHYEYRDDLSKSIGNKHLMAEYHHEYFILGEFRCVR